MQQSPRLRSHRAARVRRRAPRDGGLGAGAAAGGEPVELVTAGRAELDLTRQAEVEAWMRRWRPEVVVGPRPRSAGSWPTGAASGFPRAQPANRAEPDPRRVRRGGGEAAVPRQLLHLPRDCAAADPRGVAADGTAGAHQRGLRAGQDRRGQAVPGLPAAARGDFISAMPTNLYGPGDNFDLETSHVVPALIRKMHEAKVLGAASVAVWGTGTPRREFLHVDDLADACLFLLRHHRTRRRSTSAAART